MTAALLLDTCAAIWVGNGTAIHEAAAEALSRTSEALLSPISVWEIGLLGRNRARRPGGLSFHPDIRTWIARLLARQTLREAPLTNDIALDAAQLPGDFHNDPADRLIVATARHLGVPIVTRDRKILDYADLGHVQAVAC